MSRDQTRGIRGSILLGVGGLLLLASGGLIAAYFVAGSGSRDSVPAAEAAVTPSPPAPTLAPEQASQALSRPLTLRVGDRSVARSFAELGFAVEPALAGQVPVPIAAPPGAIEKALIPVRKVLDQSPRNASLDLAAHKVLQEVAGRYVDVPGAVAAIEAAARDGLDQVELPTVVAPAEVTVDDLGISDISHVLASFETRFSIAEKTRNDNLKMAASKLHGYILQPGVLFSFNDVVGARTQKEGYKIAHVIQAGEMVDGEAGGTCQISTTLHGAAFFAGLEIVKSRPHSRPSTYVQMGLDATVVYPLTDLKLKNPYDFPVVISYRVARGVSHVDILGKKRPYDKIAFEREVDERIDFDTVTREDYEMPIGYMVVDQLGFPGYKVTRYRKFYRDGKLVKTDKWKIQYKPVTEYVRTGANPDPNLPPPKQRKPHGPKPPSKDSYRLVQ